MATTLRLSAYDQFRTFELKQDISNHKTLVAKIAHDHLGPMVKLKPPPVVPKELLEIF